MNSAILIKIESMFFIVAVFTLNLFKPLTALADIPAPLNAPYLTYCEYVGGLRICTLWGQLLLITTYFLLGTLIIELLVYRFLFGFKTKKNLVIVIITNAISVPSYHLANALLSGTNVLIAEFLIIIFECLFIYSLLRKEMSTAKIIGATIVANLVSLILGAVIIELFFPFYYF